MSLVPGLESLGMRRNGLEWILLALTGCNAGERSLLEDRSLVPLEGSKVVVSVNAILPFRDGFIYAGEAGWVGQYVRGRFCEPFMLATQTAFFLKNLPDGTVFVTGNGDGRTDIVSRAILTIP